MNESFDFRVLLTRSLRVVRQARLLLRLHLRDALHEVLVLDLGALAAEGEALGLRGGVSLLEPREDEPGAGSFALLRSRRRTAQAGKEASRKRTRIHSQSIF